MSNEVCPFTWNPGVWPYAARCHFLEGHPGRHITQSGRRYEPSEDTIATALQHLVLVVGEADYRGPSLHREKLRALAMSWPALAAALGAVVQASGQDVPSPLRRAMQVLAQESK